MEPVLASCPIPKASIEQFAGVVSYAGEVACNIFVAGGDAVTLRMGVYVRQANPETGALEEIFQPNTIDRARDEIMMEASCFVDPAAGARDVNPFVLNLWPLSRNGQAVAIAEAMGAQLGMLPAYAPQGDYLVMTFGSDQAMFQLRKAISSIFAVAVTRGSPDVGLMLRRGVETESRTPVQKFRKVTKLVPQKKRDKTGKLIFKEAVDEGGQPVYDPVCDKAGRPLFNPTTGEIRKQRRLDYEMVDVEMPVDEPYTEIEVTKRVPLYLMVARNAAISEEEFIGLASNESAFDPTWMLTDVLSGACRSRQTFHGMEA